MLKKKHRIRKDKEFQKIFAKSKKIRSDIFQMYIHFVNISENKSKEELPKFGFVVSKKIGNAPTRNRVKRQFREIIRLEIPKLKKNFEAIVIAYPQIAEKTFENLKTEIIQLLKRNNLYKNSK